MTTEPGPDEQHDRELRTIKQTVVLYVLMMAFKLGVYFTTGIMVMLAEALHTLSDIVVSVFLLLAASYSQRAADAEHPWGHGRAQHIGALVAATIFLSFTSLELFRQSIPRLIEGAEAPHGNVRLAVGVLVGSMLVAAAPMIRLLRQKTRGAAARAQLIELINDQLGLVAALVGTLLLAAGYPIADPLATLVVACIIAVNGVGLLKENASFLLGHAPSPEVLAEVKQIALSVEGVRGVHGLRAQLVAQGVAQAELHINLDSDMTLEQAHDVTVAVRERIVDATVCKDLIVHSDPASPRS